MSKPLAIAGAAAITVALALPGVAAAKTTVRCHVPNLHGDTLAQARHKLARNNCKVGAIHGTRTGKITAQIPRAGRKMKHGSKVALTLKATPGSTPSTTTTPSPQISYAAKVDPTFTQSPTNPLAVTYAYSADATETQNGAVTDLAQADELPTGILNFYNGGQLACSMNVGGATSGGACPVTYPSVGTYSVTTQYIPNGTSAVTETDQETITPFSTTTTTAIDFGAPYDVTGPPPTYSQSTNWIDGIGLVSSDPSNASFTVTVKDVTTSATWTGAAQAGGNNGCALEFVDPADNRNTVTVNPGCGLGGFSFSIGDTLTMSVTTSGSAGYLGSSSTPETLWQEA